MTAGAGWSSDPSGAHELRYWDGEQWTDHVSDGGSMTRAPLEMEPSRVAAPRPLARAEPDTGAQLRGLLKNRWFVLLALFFVGIPVALGIAVAVTHDSSRTVVEPFDNTDAVCESWWRANVSAARDGWDDARLRREVGRIADAAEPVDELLSRYLRDIAAINADPAVIRTSIEMAYQRCVTLQWRGATDAELAVIGSPTPPTR